MMIEKVSAPHTQHPAHPHSEGFRIVVNGEEKKIQQKRLSFHEICVLAFPDGPFGGNIRYTVTYSYPDGREGSMVQGDTIEVEDGMVFYVGNTDRS